MCHEAGRDRQRAGGAPLRCRRPERRLRHALPVLPLVARRWLGFDNRTTVAAATPTVIFEVARFVVVGRETRELQDARHDMSASGSTARSAPAASSTLSEASTALSR